MRMNRRECFFQAVGGLAVGSVGAASRADEGPRFKAVAFDAFPILDPRPILAMAEEAFPGRGAELSRVWRDRQFEYPWLRALAGQYVDFWRATEDALKYAARELGLDLKAETLDAMMGAFLKLKAWPDAARALRLMNDAGVRLAFLSNATPRILDAGIKNSGLDGLFEHVLSTDSIRSYKPDPRAYQIGLDAFGLRREEIAFAAFAGWDVAGAKWFGYPTFWVNRTGAPAEELGVAADGEGRDLNDLAAFVGVS